MTSEIQATAPTTPSAAAPPTRPGRSRKKRSPGCAPSSPRSSCRWSHCCSWSRSSGWCSRPSNRAPRCSRSRPKLFGSEIKFGNFAEAWNYLPFGRFIVEHRLRRRCRHLDHAHRIGDGRLRLRPAQLPFPGRALRALPEHLDRAARGHRHPDVPGHAAARLGQLLQGPDPALGLHGLRHVPAPTVLPDHPDRARGGGQDRRGRPHPNPDAASSSRSPPRPSPCWRCSRSSATGTASCGR